MLSLTELFSTIAEDLDRSVRIFRDELGSEQPHIRQFCEHLERLRGKQLRPALVLLCGEVSGGIRPAHHVLAAVVEMVHLATLVHDDVLDEADIRRGAATVSRRWGNESAVLLGDYLFSHAFRLCSSLESQFASQLIGQTAATLCAGEMMQVSNRDNYELTEAEYYQIIEAKTAVLIAACCHLGARYAGADEATVQHLRGFGLRVGTAFQITDDLLDLVGDEAEVGKSLGRDVEKGKLTLPLIRYLDTCGPRRREELLALLASPAPLRTRRLAELLAGSDGLAYARRAAYTQVQQAVRGLVELPPSPARDALVALAESLLERRL